jgi:hypothetical protein
MGCAAFWFMEITPMSKKLKVADLLDFDMAEMLKT